MNPQHRYLVADVETTGVRPEDRIVEIAWMEVDEDLNVIEQVHSLIDPEMPIPPAASGVHHITNDMVADAPTIKQFFEVIREGRNLGSFVLVAHNAAFDRRFLEPHADEIIGELCTLRLARRLYPDVDNHKLQTLRYEMQLEAGGAHSALGDITTLLSLLSLIKRDTAMELHELMQFAMQPIEVKTMPFGKHKGVPLAEVPRSYLGWLSRQDNVDSDLRASMEAVLGS